MLPRRRIHPLLLVVPFAIAALFAFAACGDDNDDEAPAATNTPAEIPVDTPSGTIDISGVPELDDGVLTVGSDIAYAPMEFYIEGTDTPDGLDVDLAKAIGEALSVDVEFLNIGFDGIIPALNTEDFDVIISAMSIDEERSQQIDFVPYLSAGTGILVPAGNPNSIATETDLCGLTVAVQLGTIQETLVRGLSDACAEAIDVKTFDTNPLAVEDLRTGGADANLADYPVALLDATESDGDLEVLAAQVDPSPYGIGIRKSSTELAAVLEEALQAVIASGDYDALLTKWNLESAALPRD